MKRRAQIIDGRALAAKVNAAIAQRVRALRERGRRVRLDAILVEGDGAAEIYAENQARTCAELGIGYHLHRLPESAAYQDVEAEVLCLNDDQSVHAIMVHLPLPRGLDTERIHSLIAIDKDVEGVNPANIGAIVYGRRSLVPCTALAVMEMIESTGRPLRGARCVCVGASNIVGKPVAVLLMRAEATVISTNVHTRDQAALTREADVLIAAAGVPGLITAKMVKEGAVVIDVGVTRERGPDGKHRTVGDVAFDEVAEVADFISPVPGGVGPMTVAMLMRNSVDAAER
jgi:methylenetetrahydrofolate dehydrogenase (NADP+)/methenyltetrahydrofolate cyclohydrolase